MLPILAEIGPEIERNIAATHAELHEEAELLGGLVAEALSAAGAGGGATAIEAEELRLMPRRAAAPGAARAGDPGGRQAGPGRIAPAPPRSPRLAARSEGGEVELGRGLSAICEGGMVRFGDRVRAGRRRVVRMAVPGSARFGDWELQAEIHRGPIDPAGPELATLDAASIGDEVEIRAWRAGDRIRPLGLGGSKSLQDLFTDRGVPRSVRSRIPVVTANGRVAWVAGVAVSEEFRLLEASTEVAVITARAATGRL